jgi:hypothetical protein
MWVRLLKSDKKLKAPIGRAIQCTPAKARQMIEDKKAIEYNGGFPVKKMKTDFFKPKYDNDNR